MVFVDTKGCDVSGKPRLWVGIDSGVVRAVMVVRFTMFSGTRTTSYQSAGTAPRYG